MEARQGRRLAWSAAIFSLATGLSRVLGLIRETVVAYLFGSRGEINAFAVAFMIPNLVRILVADAALSGAFVPVFGELLEKGDRARAWRVASTLLWLVLLGLSAVTAVFILLAPVIVPPLIGDYDDLTVRLAQILFPIVALLGVSGIVVGILNSYEEFSIPALTPVAWNIVIIAALLLGIPQLESVDSKLYLFAGAIVLATLVQVLLPVPWLRGRGGQLRVVIDWRDPAVKRVLVLMVPVTISLGLINLNAAIGTFVAATLIDPSIAPKAIDYAFRVYMLPQGMFSVAVATVLFPALARLATRADTENFRRTIGLGLRQIGFLLLPASAFCAVLAEPIVRLIYQRGEFEPDQTPVVAGALAAFSLGLAFNGMMLLLNRAFFGLQSPRIPTLVAAGNLIFNGALYAVLYRAGTWGIPLAISIANIAGAAALLMLLRRRLGTLELAETMSALLRILLASAVLAAVAYGAWWLLDDLAGRSLPAQLVSVLGALSAGGVAYLLACRALGVREIDTLLSLRGRFRRP